MGDMSALSYQLGNLAGGQPDIPSALSYQIGNQPSMPPAGNSPGTISDLLNSQGYTQPGAASNLMGTSPTQDSNQIVPPIQTTGASTQPDQINALLKSLGMDSSGNSTAQTDATNPLTAPIGITPPSSPATNLSGAAPTDPMSAYYQAATNGMLQNQMQAALNKGDYNTANTINQHLNQGAAPLEHSQLMSILTGRPDQTLGTGQQAAQVGMGVGLPLLMQYLQYAHNQQFLNQNPQMVQNQAASNMAAGRQALGIK